MLKVSDYISIQRSTWCRGCSNFGVQTALVKALIDLKIKPHNTAITFDIGCSGNACNIYNTYGFHVLHGRIIPMAVGAKIANHALTLIALGGDGGIYGEGIGHLIEAARANFNITLIVSNNRLYSLTTGQASPTIEKGTKTKSTPQGVIKPALNPLSVALTAGASFVARGYADGVKELTDIFKAAIKHPGFAIVDVLQPCITIDKVNTREWYQKRIYQLDSQWPTKNKGKALKKAEEWGSRIPIGIFYRKTRPAYREQISFLTKKTLAETEKDPNVLHDIMSQFE